MRSISLPENRGIPLVGFEHGGVFLMKNLMPFDQSIAVNCSLVFVGQIFSDSFFNPNPLIRKEG
jgi:hypothetical protein